MQYTNESELHRHFQGHLAGALGEGMLMQRLEMKLAANSPKLVVEKNLTGWVQSEVRGDIGPSIIQCCFPLSHCGLTEGWAWAEKEQRPVSSITCSVVVPGREGPCLRRNRVLLIHP